MPEEKLMGPNQSHPDFPEFQKKWKDLWNEMDEAVKAAESREAKKKLCPGQDGTVDAIRKKYMSQITALQREFKHLYQ